jgi:hypothetical protein
VVDNHATSTAAGLPAIFAIATTSERLASLNLTAPVRYGGLRLHAFLGVWVI